MGILSIFSPMSIFSRVLLANLISYFLIGFILGSVPVSYPPNFYLNVFWGAIFSLEPEALLFIEQFPYNEIVYYAGLLFITGFETGSLLFSVNKVIFWLILGFLYIITVWLLLGIGFIQTILAILYLPIEKLINFVKIHLGGAKEC